MKKLNKLVGLVAAVTILGTTGVTVFASNMSSNNGTDKGIGMSTIAKGLSQTDTAEDNRENNMEYNKSAGLNDIGEGLSQTGTSQNIQE